MNGRHHPVLDRREFIALIGATMLGAPFAVVAPQAPTTPRVFVVELPTGIGRTHIGLSMAEFRRQRFDERVLYLVSHRVLAEQAVRLAAQNGILAHVLVGKKLTAAAFHDYECRRAIAIMAYSRLFHANALLKDADTVILDDAHGQFRPFRASGLISEATRAVFSQRRPARMLATAERDSVGF